MNPLVLSGLNGGEPLGFLAALGTLRLLGSKRPELKLSWCWEGTWQPALTAGCLLDKKGVATDLVEAMQQTRRLHLTLGPTIKVDPAAFREFAMWAQAWAIARTDREWADYCVAFGSECATARSTGDVKPTALDMTSGQQNFLEKAGRLTAEFGGMAASQETRPPIEKIEETLFGPWQYRDVQHSLGWDAGAERLYALRARDPSPEKMCTVSGAVRLAFEALPLFPTAPIGKRLETRGFARVNGATFFTWPLWTTPIGLATVASVLALPELTLPQPSTSLRARGIACVCRARRGELGSKGYAIFRATEVCW